MVLPENNFSTYSTNYLPPLIHDEHVKYLGYNSINKNEYSEITETEHALTKRFYQMVFGKYPVTEEYIGGATTGSTESLFLAALNWKKVWEDKGNTGTPNIVMNYNNHHSWVRVCGYLGIELKLWYPNFVEGCLCMVNGLVIDKLIDENTICVVTCDVFTTFGVSDNIEHIIKNVKKNHDIPVHVDAAIGGFLGGVYPDADSVNISNHKYGMSYPGLGWILFKDSESIHASMFKKTSYLYGEFKSVGFSFTKSASNIMSQKLLFDSNLHEGLINKVQVEKDMFSKHYDIDISFDFALHFKNKRVPIVYLYSDKADDLDLLSKMLMGKGISASCSNFAFADKNFSVLRFVFRIQKSDEPYLNLFKTLKHLKK